MIFRRNRLRNLFLTEYCEKLKFYIPSQSFDRMHGKRRQLACHVQEPSHHLTTRLSHNERNATDL
jgi:hypothetical protein